MWATFRFMMYWYVLWSGVRAMLRVWRFPESWIGPNFCVAPAGRGESDSTTNVATAAATQRIDIPPPWPGAVLRCGLSSPQRRGLQCCTGGAAGARTPAARPGPLRRRRRVAEERLAARQDERARAGEAGRRVDHARIGGSLTESGDEDALLARLRVGRLRPDRRRRVGMTRPGDRPAARRRRREARRDRAGRAAELAEAALRILADHVPGDR